MHKRYFLFSILVLSISLSVPQALRGQCMPNSNITPSTYVPFTSIYYISAPDEAGDMLVVGANFAGSSGVPLPNNESGNQLFCNPITLAPGIVANAYVPTVPERLGNFSAFSGLLFDPTCTGEGCPYYYPDGAITASEIPSVFAWRIPATQPGPPVYVSTGYNSQILAVDGSSGVTSVLYTPAGDTPYYDLEGLAVGPDSLIYIADPDDYFIFRIPQTGGSLQTVYQYSCEEESCGPDQVQGPSFSTTGLLTFNTEDDNGVWQISFNSSDTPSAPVQVIPPANGAVIGEGTAFNLLDELLIVDQYYWDVLQQTAPGASTTSTLISNSDDSEYLNWPVGVAVNSSGNVFVSNWNNCVECQFYNPGYIAQFDSNGNFLSDFGTFQCWGDGGPCDAPNYMQFDASGNLYVVSIQNENTVGGKVWRVSPNGTTTLLVDLGYAYNNGTIPNLGGNTAVGVALAGTGTSNSYTTPQQPVTPGVPVTYTYGNVTNQTLYIPPGSNLGDAATAYIAVNFQLWNPTVFNTTRLPATSTNAWSGGTPVLPGTTCTLFAGTGGNCVVIEDLCYDSGHHPILPCNITAPSTALIGLMSTYGTQSPQPNPGMIIADDGQNDWANISTGHTDPGQNGGSKAINTDTAIVNLGLGTVSPPSLEFGTVYLGTITIKSVTVTNYGAAPMTITDPLLWIPSGGDSNAFIAANLCPKSLAVGKNCRIDVAFLAGPNYALQTAILKVVDSGPGSPQEVFLSATVINPIASFSSYNLNFGKETVGNTSAPKTVTLTNTGATPLYLSTLTVNGNFAPAPGTTCANGETLVPKANCVIDVTFTPTATGAQQGSVVITDNARNSPQIILLSGKGD